MGYGQVVVLEMLHSTHLISLHNHHILSQHIHIFTVKS